MPKYRKKPVEVEARLVPLYDDPMEDSEEDHIPGPIEDLAEWCGGVVGYTYEKNYWYIDISTLEGTMRAMPGDYIIEGVQGEFYPYKPDIFEATYEEVE